MQKTNNFEKCPCHNLIKYSAIALAEKILQLYQLDPPLPLLPAGFLKAVGNFYMSSLMDFFKESALVKSCAI